MSNQASIDKLLTDLVLETFSLNGAMLEAGNRLTKPHQMTSARWQVMGAIELAAQPLTVAQIARRMGLARQGVQRIINDLRRMGFVTLIDNLDHKRAPLATISETGQRVMSSIDVAQREWIKQLSEGFTERQIVQTLDLMRAIKARSDGIEAAFS